MLPQDSLTSLIVLAGFAALIGWLLLVAMTTPSSRRESRQGSRHDRDGASK